MARAVAQLDLSRVRAIGLDAPASNRGDLGHLATHQLMALAELLDQALDTATAWRVKERLRWVR